MFELMGLIVTGGGLLLSALSLFGIFPDKEKIAFYEKIFKTDGEISREGTVFESFLTAFPSNCENELVSKIMPRRMDCSSTGRDAFSSVYYWENDKPGNQAVATEAEVRAWAYKTSTMATGISIACVGFGLQIVKYVIGH